MKKLLVLVSMIVMVGCARGPDGAPGANAPSPSSFAGFYVLPSTGYMEIVSDSGKLNDMTQIRIVGTNADSSLGVLPLAQSLNLPTTNNAIYSYANLNYVAGNNIKADVGNAVLLGSLFTMITVTPTATGISVRVQISSGVLTVFDHTLAGTIVN